METQLTHSTYKFVNEQDAVAAARVFVDTENMKRANIKLPLLKPNEARAKVPYAGLRRPACPTVHLN